MTRGEAIYHLKTYDDPIKVHEAFRMGIEALGNMEEIAEIMKCDADAEIKCKMISNILTAKPHYFAEPCDNAVNRQAVDTLVDELARAISDERCCMSRGRSTATIMQDILDLPSVRPQEQTGHWDCKEIPNTTMTAYWCSQCHIGSSEPYDYCPNCGAKMVEPQESEG